MKNKLGYAPELKARLQEYFYGIGILCTEENEGENGDLAKFLTAIYENNTDKRFTCVGDYYGMDVNGMLDNWSTSSNFPKGFLKLKKAIKKRDAIIAAYESEKAAQIEVKDPCIVKCTPEFCAQNNCEKAEPEKLTPWNITPETDLGEIEFLREHPAILDAMYNHSKGKNLRVFAKDKCASEECGAFDWYETKEGRCFWEAILKLKKTETFYEKYPEKLTPWNITPETDLGEIEFLREHPAILEAIYEYSESKDLTVFVRRITAMKKDGGFDWNQTKENMTFKSFFNDVLWGKNTELFYKLYPEKRLKALEPESSKVIVYMSEENPEGVLMEVSNDGENWKKEKVLFCNKILYNLFPYRTRYVGYIYARPIQEKKQLSISEAEKMLKELSNENYEIIP